MGFVRNQIYKLSFEDPSFDGLEVRAKSVPLGQILKLTKLAGQDLKALDRDAQFEAVDEMLRMFAKALVSWNVEEQDPDNPDGPNIAVPATYEGLQTQDIDFVMDIIMAWMDALMGVGGPLGKRSASGAPFLEASLPMEMSSPNPPS